MVYLDIEERVSIHYNGDNQSTLLVVSSKILCGPKVSKGNDISSSELRLAMPSR